MSPVVATQLSAVATAVLAAFAFITAVLAGLAYRKQRKEAGLLIEENKRQATERRRAQASRVFIAAACSRTFSRRALPAAVRPPPSGYLIHPGVDPPPGPITQARRL